ncbi:MAG: glutamate--tRNA ligase [Candidatus Aminicenantes bacterium]|nr:glutamate--tRNA ligase [Candidatus Aminicenantes bacterium]
MDKVRVRFAPSPTGFLHVGNARTALFNWLFARQKNGTCVLRVEDTDVERSSVEYELKLIADLKWLGLDWDEGPESGGPFGPYRQSQRLDIYASYTQKLLEERKAYYCFCSPEELEINRKTAIASGKMPNYSGKCRTVTLDDALDRQKKGEEAVVRLKTPDEGTMSYHDLVRGHLSFDLNLIGDPVLVRSNGRPAYNYVVVIDDALMEITHVIRGEDHISNTPRQILTYDALSLTPPQFAHLSMVMGKDSARLSKRHGATAVDQFDKDGILPEALFNYLALLGWSHPEEKEILSKPELLETFNLKNVSRSAAIFDYDKLHWLNRQHMKVLSSREKAEKTYPYLKAMGFMPKEMPDEQWAWLEEAVEDLIEGADRFSDLSEKFSPFFNFNLKEMEDSAKEILTSECGRKVVTLLVSKIARAEQFNYDIFAAFAQEIKDETGCKGKDLFHPLRIALTARLSGLKLDRFIPLIEAGSRLSFPKPIKNCTQRVFDILDFMG